MFGVGIALDLPERRWDLMTVGVGGYVVGRTAERGIELWRGVENARPDGPQGGR